MSSRAKGKGGKGRAPSPTRAERKAFKAVAKAERVRKAQARDVQAQQHAMGRTETQAKDIQARGGGKAAPSGGMPSHIMGHPVHGLGDSRRPGSDVQRASRQPTQEHASPHGAGGEASEKASRAYLVATQPGLISRSVVDRVIDLLMGKDFRRPFARIVRPALVQGFEAEWHMSVGAALQDLEAEFKTGDMLAAFAELTQMGQELFLREVQSKAVRILAHKKRKSKGRTK
jgi:hypothetical protein